MNALPRPRPRRSSGRSSSPSLPTVPGSPAATSRSSTVVSCIPSSSSANEGNASTASTQTSPDRMKFGPNSLLDTDCEILSSDSPAQHAASKGTHEASVQTTERNRANSYENGATRTGTVGSNTRKPTRRRLQDGMATALSLDHWAAPPTSQCDHEANPELSVNFVCVHPPIPDARSAAAAGGGEAGRPRLPAAARYQEIFIDLCALYASSYDAASRHVLDSRFDSFLGPGEREFKNAVLDLVRGAGTSEKQYEDGDEGERGGLSEAARQTSAYRRLERMLRKEMGLGTLDERQEMRVRKMRGLRRESMSAENGSNRQLQKTTSNASLGSTAEDSDKTGSNDGSGVQQQQNIAIGASTTSSGVEYSRSDNAKAEALRDLIVRIRRCTG